MENVVENVAENVISKKEKIKNDDSLIYQFYINSKMLAFELSFMELNNKMKYEIFYDNYLVNINKLLYSPITLNYYIHLYIRQLIVNNNINHFIKKRTLNCNDSMESNVFFSENFVVKVPKNNILKMTVFHTKP